MASRPLIEVELGFDGRDLSLPYATIGALTDMALSTAGATVAELDLCDTALRELLDALSARGPVTGASLDPESGWLEVWCVDPPTELDPECLEMIELGFTNFEFRSTGVRAMFARQRADS